MKLYKKYLSPGGLLLLSGFYIEDIPDLVSEGLKHNLHELKRDEREKWAALVLVGS
jgi:ribosomal protein L11 methyltransferase